MQRHHRYGDATAAIQWQYLVRKPVPERGRLPRRTAAAVASSNSREDIRTFGDNCDMALWREIPKEGTDSVSRVAEGGAPQRAEQIRGDAGQAVGHAGLARRE